MSEVERKLLARLVDPVAINEVWQGGVRPEWFADPLHGNIFTFVLEYWHASHMTEAPTPWALSQQFPGYTPVGEAEELTEYLIALMRQHYTTNQLQRMLRKAATASLSDPDTALKELYTAAYTAAEAVVPRILSSDMTNVEERERRYQQREDHPQGLGVPYGLDLLDIHTGGVLPGELAIVGGFAKTGKAQPVDSRVATPSGWVQMGDLAVGDLILGLDGCAQKVTGVFDRGVRRVWEVTTTAGVTVEVCGEHLWSVYDRWSKAEVVITTEQMAQGFRGGSANTPRFRLPIGEPAQFEVSPPLPLDPYLLGALLGDGGMTTRVVTFTNLDESICREVSRMLPAGVEMTTRTIKSERCPTFGFRHRGRISNHLVEVLDSLGLIGKTSLEKFIPGQYKMASVDDRLALVQGLLDTDGTCERTGSVVFCTSSRQLMADFREVVQSLGGTATLRVKRSRLGGVDSYTSTVRLPVDMVPFRASAAKVARVRLGRGAPRASVSEVRRTERFVPMRCIAVSNPDHLYRTEGHTMTHNTFFLLHAAVQAVKAGLRPVVFTLEMSIAECEDRVDAFYSGLSYNRLSRGHLTPEEKEQLRIAREEVGGQISIERPVVGDRTVPYLCSHARQKGADLLLIDQLSFMDPGRKVSSLKEHHSIIMNDLKNEVGRSGAELPCLLAVQANRNSQAEGLTLSSFSNAVEIEQTCDIALGLSQTQALRNNRSMRLDILGSRRSDKNAYRLAWDLISRSEIRVLEQIRE